MCEKTAQKHQTINQTVTIAQPEQEVAAVRHDAELFQPAQQTAQEATLPGQAMARAIARQLPAGGDGVEPPPTPPVPLQEEQAAPKSKKERKLLKQRQEETQRRREEEAQRAREEEARRLAEERRRQQEEEDRAEEGKRQRRRQLLFQDEAVRSLMEAFTQEQDPQKAMEKAQDFLRAAGQKLLDNDQELADWNAGSVDYVSQVATPFRLLIATQVEDGDTADALLEKNQEHYDRFAELAKERPLVSLANRELLNILREECADSSVLERAAFQMSEQFEERSNEQRERWEIFEGVVARNVHMPPQEGSANGNVFASGSPFRYLMKPETIAKFQSQTEALMRENATLTREAAEKQVFAQHRQELEEASRSRTLENSVVHDVSDEDWKQHGGASFHHILPAAQAYKVVENSDGFLYAKPAGNGLCELRPTLPETVQINGESIPLRRSYTLFVKALMHRALDKNGDLRPNAEALALDMCDHYTNEDQLRPEALETNLHNDLKTALTEMLGGDEAQAEQTISHLKKLMASSSERTFPPFEIMNNFAIAAGRMNAVAFNAAASEQFAEIQEKMQREGRTPEEINEAIRQQVNATRSMYADMDQALREMKAIRDMDPDSPDTPLPNACSANAVFVQGIRKDYMGRENVTHLTFRTAKHIFVHPMQHIEYCISHIDQIVPAGEKEKTLKNLRDIAAKLTPAEENGEPPALSEKDWVTIRDLTVEGYTAPSKYDYHKAANLGQMQDGTRITSEGFAAETKQYVVAPFSRHHAVGLYHGAERREIYIIHNDSVNDGMVAYYNKDNPLPSEAEALLAETKGRLAGARRG